MPKQVTIAQALAMALQQHQAGNLAAAEPLYRQILALQPKHADALHYLGVIAHQQGRNDSAVDLIRQAIAARPNYPEAHDNLGNALNGMGMLDEAIVAYRKAGVLMPRSAQTRNNLGLALLASGQIDEAMNAFREAVKIDPHYSPAYSNLSNTLLEKRIFEEAMTTARKAIALDSRNAKAHGNLGNALRDTGNLEQAIQAYRQTLLIEPANADAHLNYSIALLLRGDLAQGWEEYEWRWECAGYASMRRNFSQPQWDGSPLNGKTLLLHVEQGLGDAIQFSRYVPLIAEFLAEAAAPKIIFEIHPELQRLFQTFAKQCTIVLRGKPLPPFDVQCRLLSLPRIFKTTLASIAATVPYLFPDANLVETWRTPLSSAGPEMKVALTWAGNPNFKGDQTRSISLDRLSPLAALQGINFYSIQKGYAAQQVLQPPVGLRLIDLSADLHDFADTAAVISMMDLVITTDTSVAHLAGALGKPVWLMLQFVPYFLWLLKGEESPWYPSMRLFRQPARGDWDSVIKQVVKALKDRVGTAG